MKDLHNYSQFMIFCKPITKQLTDKKSWEWKIDLFTYNLRKYTHISPNKRHSKYKMTFISRVFLISLKGVEIYTKMGPVSMINFQSSLK